MSDSKNISEQASIGSNTSSGYQSSALIEALDSFSSWATRYMDSLEDRDVSLAIEPGALLSKLPGQPPKDGMSGDQWKEVISDIENLIEPGLVHWQSPRFFAYFPCSASVPGVLGELVSSVLNVNGMLWSTSPAVTELEMQMMDWCASMFGLPDQFRFDSKAHSGGGCIQGTASEAALAALVAARRAKVDIGFDRSKMTVYTSTQAHSSILKAAMVAGLADGPEDFSRVRLVTTTNDLAMDTSELKMLIEKDIADGLVPCMVSTTQGSTSTGAVDPLNEIGNMLDLLPTNYRPWLHVDAAWAGAACVCPEHRSILDGLDRADSLCINPHKWLLTNFDCDLFWVRDRKALTDSMSITPAYLKNKQSESGEVIDFRDWHVPLGRRFRAIKLWFVIRYFGTQGLENHIRSHVQLAEQFESFIESEPGLCLAVDRSLALVCFRVVGENDRTKALIEGINARRRVLISHTIVPLVDEHGDRSDCWVARVAIGSSSVQEKDVQVLIDEIQSVLKIGFDAKVES